MASTRSGNSCSLYPQPYSEMQTRLLHDVATHSKAAASAIGFVCVGRIQSWHSRLVVAVAMQPRLRTANRASSASGDELPRRRSTGEWANEHSSPFPSMRCVGVMSLAKSCSIRVSCRPLAFVSRHHRPFPAALQGPCVGRVWQEPRVATGPYAVELHSDVKLGGAVALAPDFHPLLFDQPSRVPFDVELAGQFDSATAAIGRRRWSSRAARSSAIRRVDQQGRRTESRQLRRRSGRPAPKDAFCREA